MHQHRSRYPAPGRATWAFPWALGRWRPAPCAQGDSHTPHSPAALAVTSQCDTNVHTLTSPPSLPLKKALNCFSPQPPRVPCPSVRIIPTLRAHGPRPPCPLPSLLALHRNFRSSVHPAAEKNTLRNPNPYPYTSGGS